MRRILTAILAIISIQAYSQVSVSDSLSTERFQVRNGAIRGTYPKASAYVDVNTSGLVAIRQLGSDRIIVNYQAANLYVINGANTAVLDSAVSWLGDVIGLDYCCSTSGGGSSDGTNLIQFSDGSGGFYGLDSVIDEIGTLYFGTGNNIGSLELGINNEASGEVSFAMGFADTATGNFALALQFANKANGLSSLAMGSENVANGILSFVTGDGNVVNRFAQVAFGQHSITTIVNDTIFDTDTVFAYGNGVDEFNESNALTLQRNGNLNHTGIYSNTSYVIDTTVAAFTVPDNSGYMIFNPASLRATKTINMPANPKDGQYLTLSFGGSITTGTVVTALTIAANAGQTVLLGAAGAAGTVINPLTFIYIGALNQWRLVSN